MNRRNLFLAASATAIAPGASFAVEGDTPVARLYRDWRAAYAFANVRDLDEDEVARRADISSAIERRIEAEPIQSVRDLALKLLAVSSDGEGCTEEACDPNLWADIRRLAEGVA